MTLPLHVWSTARTVICLPADPGADARAALAQLIDGPAPVDAVLDHLVARGIGHAPDFFCATVDGAGLRIAVRGACEAVAHGADGASRILGAGRAVTWRDDMVDDVTRLTVRVGPGGAGFDWLVRPDADAEIDADADGEAR